jgi:hypothetical protein
MSQKSHKKVTKKSQKSFYIKFRVKKSQKSHKKVTKKSQKITKKSQKVTKKLQKSYKKVFTWNSVLKYIFLQ